MPIIREILKILNDYSILAYIIMVVAIILVGFYFYYQHKKNIADRNYINWDDIRENLKKEKTGKKIETKRADMVQPSDPVNKIFIKFQNKVLEKSEFEDGKFYFQVDKRNYFEELRGWRKWISKRRFRKKRWKYVLVRMNMENNTVFEFFIPIVADGFIFQKGQYIFDDTNKYWLTNSAIWCYDFHQTIDIPIRLREKLPDPVVKYLKEYEQVLKTNSSTQIDTDKIRDIIDAGQTTAVKSSLNPKSLRNYLKSNFIQGLVQGAALGKVFRIIMILMIITLVITVATLILVGYDSGVFSDLTQ